MYEFLSFLLNKKPNYYKNNKLNPNTTLKMLDIMSIKKVLI